MIESIKSPSASHSMWPRFSLRSVLWLVVVVALALSCLVVSRRLRDAKAALARNSWAAENAPIPPGKFRLLINRLIESDDIQVVVIRFESNEEHFVTADGAGCQTSPSEGGEIHWAEVRIVASFDSTANHLTTLTQAKSDSGTAGGKSIFTLQNGQDPKEFMAIDAKPGVYDLQQVVELFRDPDGAVTLSVK